MDEVLTMSEIEERYPSEWVLLDDPEVDERLGVIRGKVVAHNADRDEFDREASGIHPKRAAYLYIGEPPAGMEFMI